MKLEESYSARLGNVYKLEKGPRTLDELAQVWNQRLLRAAQTPKGKQRFDALARGEIAYGECQAKTRHTVRLRGGRSVHVACALDALIEGVFQDVEIESSCPHCQDTITLEMVNRQIVATRPESTVLWLGISPQGEGPTIEVLCPFINLFASQDHVIEWRQDNPEQVGALLSLSQAHDFITKALASTPHLQSVPQ